MDNLLDAMSNEKDGVSPLGSNIDCTPAPGENPVVLVHGLIDGAYTSFGAISPALTAQGKCTYAFDFGRWDGSPEAQGSSLVGSIPNIKGMAPMDQQVDELADAVARVKQHTGAKEVDLVGFSAGGSTSVSTARGSARS